MTKRLQANLPQKNIFFKDIHGDWRTVAKHLFKGVRNIIVLDAEKLAEQAIEALKDFGLRDQPEELLFAQLFTTIGSATIRLLREGPVLRNADHDVLADLVGDMAAALAKEAEARPGIFIDAAFIETPQAHLPFHAVAQVLIPWLEQRMPPLEARWIAARFPITFEREWFACCIQANEQYTRILDSLDMKKEKAETRFLAWRRHGAWLQAQTMQCMMGEAFGLAAVYIPLRGVHCQRVEDARIEKEHRRLVWLEESMDAWLATPHAEDPLRIISGGPGSGKSSFVRMLAARLALSHAPAELRVVFVPLHELDLGNDSLSQAIKNFADDSGGLLPTEPLGQDAQRVLLVLDGLDELVMHGASAIDAAKKFIESVIKLLKSLNRQGQRLRVLIAGRELAVQATSDVFRQANWTRRHSVLHVLPYAPTYEETCGAEDPGNLRCWDQRETWWQAYGLATGRFFQGLSILLKPETTLFFASPRHPSEKADTLFHLTRQPLLNYLVARASPEDTATLSLSNRVELYERLLHDVYDKGWNSAGRGHPLQEEQFYRIVEEIAVCVWHHGGESAPLLRVKETICTSTQHSALNDALDALLTDAEEASLGAVLLAFYFRFAQLGNKSIEFSHKTFWEYLVARRIVGQLERMTHARLDAPGWEHEAALTWARLCGPREMHDELYDFLEELIAVQTEDVAAQGQEACCRLIEYVFKESLPMHELGLTFREQRRQARNAEISLLATHCACATRVNAPAEKGKRPGDIRRSVINWPDEAGLRAWLAWLEPDGTSSLARRSLAYLHLEKQKLANANFFGANLSGANLQDTNLHKANFHNANLREANLHNANLREANICEADLSHARLPWASLRGAKLHGVKLHNVILSGADLGEARIGILREASPLSQATFHDPPLREALDLGVNLEQFEDYRIGSPTSEQAAALAKLVAAARAGKGT